MSSRPPSSPMRRCGPPSSASASRRRAPAPAAQSARCAIRSLLPHRCLLI
jgi:hypothetical protein